MACQHFPFNLCRFNTIIHSGSLACRGPFQLEMPSRQYTYVDVIISLQWRHNGRDGVSNHQSHHCFLNRLFRRRSKKTSKLRVTGLYAWNSLATCEFPAQMASNAENVSIRWRHHVLSGFLCAENHFDTLGCRYNAVHHNTMMHKTDDGIGAKWIRLINHSVYIMQLNIAVHLCPTFCLS